MISDAYFKFLCVIQKLVFQIREEIIASLLFCGTARSSTFVQFIAMEIGHTNAKGVHHNSYSSVTVVGQL